MVQNFGHPCQLENRRRFVQRYDGVSVIRIGTSGWHYKHWRGPFYPENLPASRYLQYYQQHFDTVEINNSFYKLPNPSTLENWRDSAPAGFLFAVKASRFITHNKKLKNAQGSFDLFFERVRVLGKKMGPILFQLPPHWGPDPSRLDQFLAGLPRRLQCAFELRNPEWFIPEVEAVLKKRRAAFCIYDIGGRQSPKTITADFVYVRLHGPGGPYQGSYSDKALAEWARDFRRWEYEGRDVYCYFDNDQAGYAAKDALRLKADCESGATGRSPARARG
jgi:uncharacterized protein YecE (DUF72 family)